MGCVTNHSRRAGGGKPEVDLSRSVNAQPWLEELLSRLLVWRRPAHTFYTPLKWQMVIKFTERC